MALTSFVAGQKLRASQLKGIVDQVNSLTLPGWTTYTPTWTAGGGGTALGNGTISAQYRQAAGSDLVTVRMLMTWGSTTTNGTGNWFWTLPVTANASNPSAMIGAGWVLDSGAIRYPLTCYLPSTTTMGAMSAPFANTATTVNSRGGDVGGTSPFTLATADQIGLTLTYQAA